MRFTGRTAIVTGGARGIGQAAAARMFAEGGRVLIADVDLAGGEEAAAELGPNAAAHRLNVTSEESWQETVERTISLWGKIDVLVNNAGVAGDNIVSWEMPVAEWKRVIDIDLTGVFLGCRAVVPHMIGNGYGRIVNVASIAGKEGNPNAVAYSAAKAGVIGLTKSIGKETATKGVLVNCIAPAVIETPILAQVSDAHKAYMLQKIPMSRLGQPSEVGALIAFLASDDLSFSTGAVYDISGGRATY
ncbi:MAG: SDR family oxidoreductase [Chloroflexota bacterium]